MSSEFSDLTFVKAAETLAGSVVLLPFGSVEPHGPHLPLATDTILSVETARRAAVKIKNTGSRVFVAPAIPYAVTDFSKGFAGRISLSPSTAAALALEICLAIAEAVPKKILLITLHFEPEHIQCLRAAAAACREKTGVDTVFVDFTKRRAAERIGGEFATGSCHAGSFESSLVMAARPELVMNTIREGLPNHTVPLPERMKAGAKTFLECGMTDAYCGEPAAASASEGDRLYNLLSDLVAESARA
ncbi:MAG: creatininase family protein [Planctomycetota bacterium]